MKYIYIIQAAVLACAAIEDIRKKEIKNIYILIVAVLSVVGIIINDNRSIFDSVAGLSIGLSLIGISVLCKEQIGTGDGLLMTAIGPFIGLKATITTLCIASFITAIMGIVLIVAKRGKKNTQLPFVPAICAGYVICLSIMGAAV